MRARLLLAFALVLASCTTSAQRMQGFVGRSIQDVMAYRGPPQGAFDMPDGRRAFQWIDTYDEKAPVSVQSVGTVTDVGAGMAMWSQNTRLTGGGPITSRCVFTMYSRWDDPRHAWVVVGFERPRPECNGGALPVLGRIIGG